MLFNSLPFIFLFLPLVIAGFFVLGRYNRLAAAAWLALASFVFYGWWSPKYVLLLAGSILFNYTAGLAIVRAGFANDARRKKHLLIFAITANLALLGYYKYANFFLDNFNALTGTGLGLGEIILPLGISFFTFTQIAFLADAYQGKAREYNLVHYGLFVTYFPHLIAGPILHHGEMMPQFARQEIYRPDWDNLAAGTTIFLIGLFKKVMIADEIGPYGTPIFDAARSGEALSFLESWCGALAYTFQLYFDFSGYSDMAVGLSLMFGVRLPINFHSPYKAVNIIDFWRRWHMTLSRFLRDYLYVPLGGNRKSAARRYVNLMITMVLGGLWHGAGWTFVLWGALHGFYLIINHAWLALRRRLGHNRHQSTAWGRRIGCGITFVAVVAGWVVFRAESVPAATNMLSGMAGLNGFTLPDVWLAKLGSFGQWLAQQGATFNDTRGLVRNGLINWIIILLAIVWLAPNTQQIMSRYRPALGVPVETPYRGWLLWRPSAWLALPVAVLAVICVVNLHKQSEFLYFQF
ncbi:MAG: MBOAT family protein [Betaproteobacteria bacterium]|nr:MBOAT family protein [Betaproteobacteria bacterium]